MDNISFTTTAPGVSAAIRGEINESNLRRKNILHRVRFNIVPTGTTKISAAKIQIQGSADNSGGPALVATDEEGPVISAALAVGSTAEKIAHGLFYFRIGAANYSKAADAVGVVFTAAHKIAANKFGAINVYIDAAGDISTWIDSAAQTDTLSHDTAALALAEALASDFPHPASTVKIGTILIANNGVLWTANTDDMTNGVDVTTATFYNDTSSFSLLYEYTLTADDIAAQKGVFYKADIPDNYKRIFLSEMTGDGQFVITADDHIVSLPG